MQVNSKKLHPPVLTGLRFVAALSVLVAHALCATFQHDIFLRNIALQLAYLGLTLFFVLSGCVLTLNYADDLVVKPFKTIYNFWVARIARLYPLYLFCISLYLVFVPWTPELIHMIIPADLLLTQSWTYSWVTVAPRGLYFFPYAWSISVEWFFYLIWPLMMWLLWRTRRWFVDLICFSLLYVGTILVLLKAYKSVALHGHAEWHGIVVVTPVQFLQWLAYYSPYAHLSAFFVGCLVGKYLIHRHKQNVMSSINSQLSRWYGVLMYLVIGIVIGLLFMTPPDSQRTLTAWDLPKHGMLYAPVIGVLVYSLTMSPNWVASLLSRRPCQLFGETSFSIYLLHPLFAGLFGVPGLYSTLIIVLFTLVVSFGTYSLIEVPGRRLIRGALRFRPQKDQNILTSSA